MHRLGLLATLAVFAIALTASTAQARKVANPTDALSVSAQGGSFVIGANAITGVFGATTGSPLITGASVQSNGALSVAASGFHFAPLLIPDTSGQYTNGCTINYTVSEGSLQIVIPTAATGSLNPFSGQALLDFSAYLKVHYKFDATGCGSSYSYTSGPDCTIGTEASPIGLHFVSTSAYSESTGEVQVAENTAALPGSSGDCDPKPYGFTFYTFNQAAGLPSGSGSNHFKATLRLDPIITRGVVARFTSSVNGLTASLDGAVSAIYGLKTAVWSFGDGSPDASGTATILSHAFPVYGTYPVRLTLTDNDGDSDSVTQQVAVPAPVATPSVTPIVVVPRVLSALRIKPKSLRVRALRRTRPRVTYVASAAGMTTVKLLRGKHTVYTKPHADLKGLNTLRLKLKRLKPARYRLVISPGGTGKALTATFRVKR